MQKRLAMLGGIIVLIILLVIIISKPEPSFVIYTQNNQSVHFTIETASTEVERERGLMFRSSLPSSAGMLFIFDDTALRTFWMKNTLLPLDMIFFDANFTIVDIIKNAQPCVSDPCPIYPAHALAQYVLEVKGNLTTEKLIQVGDQAQWSH